MRKFNYLLVLTLGVALALFSCQDESVLTPEPDIQATLKAKYTDQFSSPNRSGKDVTTTTSLSRTPSSATYEYYVFGIAGASNGDSIFMVDDGNFDLQGQCINGNTLTTYPKSAQGTGIFTHTFANGDVVHGTWEATDLLNFHDYGPSPVLTDCFFNGWLAGSANIKIHMVADGGAEFNAILRIQCLLPEVDTPNSWVEGFRLAIQGGVNFNKSAAEGGGTLFIDPNCEACP